MPPNFHDETTDLADVSPTQLRARIDSDITAVTRRPCLGCGAHHEGLGALILCLESAIVTARGHARYPSRAPEKV